MNGIELPASAKINPDLLRLVDQLKAGILSGQITSLACVSVSPLGNMQWPGIGMQLAEMLIGAELMREDMKAAIRGGGGKILRAG